MGAILGISRRKVYQLIGTQELYSVKLGKCRRIPRVAIERYLEQILGEGEVA